MWELYCQWRFREEDPDVLWGIAPSRWRSRVEAVLVAFSMYAGEMERTLLTILEGFKKDEDEEEG